MSTLTTIPSWVSLAAHAGRIREQVGESLRRWGALHHAKSLGGEMPSRWMAAVWMTTRPVRCSIAAASADSTDRDFAEAAADDLWDAVAVAWSFVRWVAESRLPHDPGTERIVAELHAAGRWLAEYPVAVAAHEAALSHLFASGGVG